MRKARLSVLALTLLLAGAVLVSQSFPSISASGTVTSTTVTPAAAFSEQGQQIGKHTLSWTCTGTCTTCTIQAESATSLGGTFALLPGTVAQTCTSNGSYTFLSQSQNAVRLNPTAFTGSGSIAWYYTGFQNTAGVSDSGNITAIYNTAPAAGTASISATIMAHPLVDTTVRFSTYVTQTVVGASCAGNSTIQVALVYQDPNAASAQTVNTALYTVTTNGTIGNVPWTSGEGTRTIRVKADTDVKFQTTFTAGGSCSPAPTVQVFPRLDLL